MSHCDSKPWGRLPLRRVPLTLITLFFAGCGMLPEWLVKLRPTSASDGSKPLSRSISPTHYSLDLALDPTNNHFHGQVNITVQSQTAVRHIHLHGGDLEVLQAEVEDHGGIQEVEALKGPNGGLTLRLARSMKAGAAVFRIRYRGRIHESPRGIYKRQIDGKWYLFSRLSRTDARLIFPCFDEPRFKTPFRLVLTIPKAATGLANTASEKQIVDGTKRRIEFRETAPLPTYLIALAAGEFDAVPVAVEDGEPTIRILTTQGKRVLAKRAAQTVSLLYRYLRAYFGRSVYQKIDLLAVPGLPTGATEGAGLFKFRETLILTPPNDDSPRRNQWQALVLAHELVHHWWGNFITMDQWQDLWLTEGLATWLSRKAVNKTFPSADFAALESQNFMDLIGLEIVQTTPPIRPSVTHPDRDVAILDGASFGKSAAIIEMIEALVGPELFRRSLQDYLPLHANQPTNAEDFLGHLSRQDKRSSVFLDGLFRRYLDQSGMPLVRMKLTCEGPQVSLTLSQERARHIGDKRGQGSPWSIPVCVRFGVESTGRTACHMLKTRRAVMALPTATCPRWIHGNANLAGYYTWVTDPVLLTPLFSTAPELTDAELTALPAHVLHLLQMGMIGGDALADALTRLSQHNKPLLRRALVRALLPLHQVALESTLGSNFSRWLKKLLIPPRVEGNAEPETAQDTTNIALVYMLRDEQVGERMRELVPRLLKDPRSVDAKTLMDAMAIAAWQGDSALWESLKRILDKQSDPVARLAAAGGLGSFREPKLFNKSLALAFTGTLRPSEFVAMSRGIHYHNRKLAWTWLTLNYDRLKHHFGDLVDDVFARTASRFCSVNHQDIITRFYKGRYVQNHHSNRRQKRVMENIDRCIKLRSAAKDSFLLWLRNQPSSR